VVRLAWKKTWSIEKKSETLMAKSNAYNLLHSTRRDRSWRSRDFCKFLAGAFFVSGGIQLYLYIANVSVPLLGTRFVQTPELSGVRSIVHFIFFLICFYVGFIRKSKEASRRE
jgi:hypothetical protein